MPDLTRATDAQVAAWTARAAHYRREGHTGVASLVEDMLAALKAERTLEAAESLIADLADPEPCTHFDHHGYCQTHGWLQAGRCAHARAQEFLSRRRATDV